MSGNVLSWVQRHGFLFEKNYRYRSGFRNISIHKNAEPKKGYSLESVRGRINCLNKPESDGSSPPQTIGIGAKVIYAAAPALGHNKVYQIQPFTSILLGII